MHLTISKLDLIWDGFLPRDSMAGDRYRQVFCSAKPLIDYAFKVDRTAFVRVWWFDRYLPNVLDMSRISGWPKYGRFYPVDFLLSETDRLIAYYLAELGWQVRLGMYSIDRQEYMTLVVFSAEGAILKEREEYMLRSLRDQLAFPEGAPLRWEAPADPRKIAVGC